MVIPQTDLLLHLQLDPHDPKIDYIAVLPLSMREWYRYIIGLKSLYCSP